MNKTAKVDAVGQSSQTSSMQAGATPLKAPEPFVDSEEAGRFLSLRPRRVLEVGAPFQPIRWGRVCAKSGVSVCPSSLQQFVHVE
jgi:hypothetical protein